MSKRVLSIFLVLCLFCSCTKTEETPTESPQEPMETVQTEQPVEEEKAEGLVIPTITRDSQITDEDVRQLLIFLGAYESEDGSLSMVGLFDPLKNEWTSKRMTAVCYNWYQMKMKRQYTVAELNEKYTGPNGREYNDDWYYPAEEFIPEAEKYFDLDAVNLRSNEFYYHEDTDCFVFLGDRGSFDNNVSIDGWDRFEDKLQIYLTFSTTVEELNMKPYQTVLTIRLENRGFRYMSHRILAPQADKSTIYRILAALTENKDSSYLEIKDWKQHDRLLTIDLYDKLLQQDSHLTTVYHEYNGEWDWRCVSYDEAEQAKQYTTQLTVHESYEGDALSDEKINLRFTLPDGITLKESFSVDDQAKGLFLYHGGERLGRISVYKDANAEFFNSKAEPWPMTSDFADLSAEMNRGCYRHITEYPAKEFWPFERGIAYYLNLDGYCMDVWVLLDCSKPEQQELVEALLKSVTLSEVQSQVVATKMVQMSAGNYSDLQLKANVEMQVPQNARVDEISILFDETVERAESFYYCVYRNGHNLSQDDLDFMVGLTEAFRWVEVKGKKVLVTVQETMYSNDWDDSKAYIYRYSLPLEDDSGMYLGFSIISKTDDFDLALAEQREFVQSMRLLKLQANENPIPEEALTVQQKELVNIVESLDILGLTVNESMPEQEKGLFILWLLNQDEYVDLSRWDKDAHYEIPLISIQYLLDARTPVSEIEPLTAFDGAYGAYYNEKEQYLYVDELGGYGGARAHGLISIEEDENRTAIVLGSYDMEAFWSEPPIYTLQQTITAVFEFQWGQWRIVDMSRT